MQFSNPLFTAIALAAGAVMAQSASAAIIISEVDASGSGTSYAADWFELTNTGSAAVNISGWKMDDNSNSAGSAVALRGVTSIAAGQSVIFLEGNSTGSNDASIQASFKAAWFGSNVPANLVLGGYGGSGVGLSQSGDAVNIFDASNTLITRVDFGTAAAGTFDNTAGLNNGTITQISAVGVNGAFASLTTSEIGSPGVAAAPVPLPAAAYLLISGVGLLGGIARRKRTV